MENPGGNLQHDMFTLLAMRHISQLTGDARYEKAADAYLTVIAAISRVRALRQALESSQAANEATQAGFEVGTRTAVDVLITLRSTYEAERDYARARYDYILNTLSLYQAAGILSKDHLEAIARWLR